MNKTWHQEHFVCTHCKQPITSSRFTVHDGMPYCEDDYANLFLQRCKGCNQPIKDVSFPALNILTHDLLNYIQ